MIKAVLFDMDETLLDINLNAFILTYQALKDSVLAKITNKSSLSFAIPSVKAYLALESHDRDEQYTNAELYNKVFYKLTGIPLGDDAIQDALQYFDTHCIPNNRFINAHAKKGAHESVCLAQALGMRVALATNPSFSKECIYTRMKWGHLDELNFDYVTHMSNSYRLKPSHEYYAFIAQSLGVELHECLMVGNDPHRDILPESYGMKTAFVGSKYFHGAFWSGSMEKLPQTLPYLIDQINEQDNFSR